MCAYHESDLDKSLLCISACVLKAMNVRNVSSGFIEVGISDFFYLVEFELNAKII